MLRGVRGATTVDENTEEQILEEVTNLLSELVTLNMICLEDIAAIIFSSTPDLNAAFPAKAARKMGWSDVPLFGTQEIEAPDAVEKCVRALILWNTAKSQKEIQHLYLKGAAVLRQDIVAAAKEKGC
ncbi:MAG: chorismate mutase [Negativicutes bacterium]|nr:chorismate mutase [Negativicutes bacterium]